MTEGEHIRKELGEEVNKSDRPKPKRDSTSSFFGSKAMNASFDDPLESDTSAFWMIDTNFWIELNQKLFTYSTHDTCGDFTNSSGSTTLIFIDHCVSE